MTRQRPTYAALGLLFLLMPVGTSAQASGSTQSNVPMIGSGQMPTAIPGADQIPTNIFQMDIGAGVRFDDKVVLGSAQRQSDIGYSFSPSLAFVQTLRRLSWGLSYGPGLDISQHGLFTNQFTNDFGGHVTWSLSKRSVFSAQQNYILSTNPFQQFGSQPFTTTPGPLVAPNRSIYLPNIRRTASLSQVQYSYQLSSHTTFGVGGSFDLDRYRDTSRSGASLINSQVASGQAFISHQFSPRNQLGFHYGAQVLKFQQGNARTTTHSFLIFDEMKLTSNSNLTVYAGPEYSLTSNQITLNLGFVLLLIPLKENAWTWSAGGIYTLNGQRGAMVLNYSRRVSNGGGLTGAVELNGGSAVFSWKLSPRWNMNLNLAAADNQLLAVRTASNDLLSYSASLGLNRQIARRLFLNLFFARLNQAGGLQRLGTGNHDLAGVSLHYNFLWPIGR